MNFKLVPPLNGLTGLVMATTGCTINGVAGILLLVLISIDTKLGGNFVLYFLEFVPLWTLEQFATTLFT